MEVESTSDSASLAWSSAPESGKMDREHACIKKKISNSNFVLFYFYLKNHTNGVKSLPRCAAVGFGEGMDLELAGVHPSPLAENWKKKMNCMHGLELEIQAQNSPSLS